MSDLGYPPPIDRFLARPPVGCMAPIFVFMALVFAGTALAAGAVFDRLWIGAAVAAAEIVSVVVILRALSKPKFILETDADGVTMRRPDGMHHRVYWRDVTDTAWLQRTGHAQREGNGEFVLRRREEAVLTVPSAQLPTIGLFIDVVNRATPHLNHVHVEQTGRAAIASAMTGRGSRFRRLPRHG